ncbi:hypothetical protein [Campylobacter geochelonis]|nr:hypothetical protein [Campylobacter geochelonis]CZE49252.1 integral membrane protein [Campylobacter geochelonis]CZE51290.1 integral membrane protein [Campylobacter geochelonis]
MQRNRNDIYFLKNAMFVILIVSYQVIASLFQSIPPLIGLFFAYVVILNYEKERNYKDFTHHWYQSIAYLFLAEQVHGFELFSVAITFGIFYYFVFDYLLTSLKFRNLLLVILVCVGYIGTFLVSNLISYMKNSPKLELSYEYGFYILVESAIAFLLFRGRIL